MRTKSSWIILIFYIAIAVWWATLYFLHIKYSFQDYLYQGGLGMVPLLGGFLGLRRANAWGSYRSQVGKALFFISLGLISWGLGQMAWTYYNLFTKIAIPYPSFADVGYIIAVPLWAYGIINLSKATGARFSLGNIKGKLLLFIVPILAIVFSYYLLVVVARGGVVTDTKEGLLKVFFDLAYPIGDVIIVSLSALIYGLSFKYLGGRYKMPIITLLLGFVVMYLTDFSFSYFTTIGQYYDGHFVDLMFPTAMVIMSLGVNNFDTKT